MAKPRAWDGLSGAYRQRLERAGISKSEYERGISLTKARGHSKTPERPERAYKQREKYKEYLEKRGRGAPPKFDVYAAAEAKMIRYFGKGPYVDSMTRAEAEWTANADYHSLLRRATKQYKGNPWYYH